MKLQELLEAEEKVAKALPEKEEDGFFLLGSWGNPYRAGDNEYYWSGPFQERKQALAVGKMKQKHGQPKNFRDWSGGTNKVIQGLEKFKIAAKKVGLNPNVSDLYWKD